MSTEALFVETRNCSLYPPSERSELANILFYFIFRPSFRPSVCEYSEAIGKRGEVWTQDLCAWGQQKQSM